MATPPYFRISPGTQSGPTDLLTACNGTSWINMGNLLFWAFMYALGWNPLSLPNRRHARSFLLSHTPLSYSSENSVLGQDLQWRVCEHQLSNTGAVHTYLCVLSYCLEWNLLIENFLHSYKLLPACTWHFLYHIHCICIIWDVHSNKHMTNTVSGNSVCMCIHACICVYNITKMLGSDW